MDEKLGGLVTVWTTFIYGFLAGLAASPHCMGMCGGFPLHLAKASNKRNILLRQFLFIVGKTFTYVFLGTVASAFGAILLKDTAVAAAAPIFRISAGVITIFFGLLMLGFHLPSIKPLQGIADSGFVRSTYGSLLHAPGLPAAFVLGLGIGFLPCPLPITMLGLAAVSHDIPSGIMLMAGVGLGTAPALLALGLFGIGIDRRFGRYGMRAVGTVVIIIGLLTVGRATGAIGANHTVHKVVPSCCQGHTK